MSRRPTSTSAARLVARALGTCTRHERKAARDAGKYDDIKTHEYTPEEFEHIDETILDEEKNIRGGTRPLLGRSRRKARSCPRSCAARLSLMDTMGFLVGCGRGHTHGVIFKNAVKHPGHFFRNPEAGGGIEYTGIGHHRESTAKEVGVPGRLRLRPAALGVDGQRSSPTGWATPASSSASAPSMRRFNTMGDCTWARGTVTRKYIKDGYALVDIEIKGENQRGETDHAGPRHRRAAVARSEHPVFVDGAGLDLELPVGALTTERGDRC